ncbi:MarR family winged helix-turn-helix transcriptional regulator [Fodinibius sp.]|uniref:MarR family winged helix-turn-helix transcriptional regulator n=1 Tax=Fodinibius sp. TaxID=1872440 RepID=UPI002ACD4CA1|nr:MarR family transcriptional regulator [Fodinibius sp.]MDZ7658943.1 MarR family transcriptional regulator [Fodinibius sp.]
MANRLTENNIFFLTSAFARKLGNQADQIFETVGLSSSHALLLHLVNKNPEVQPSQLAKMLHLKPSTITRLVQKLDRRGLVKKQSAGRAKKIVCTSDGQNTAEEVQKKWEKLIQLKREELGERYVEVLSEMISNALDTMEEKSE